METIKLSAKKRKKLLDAIDDLVFRVFASDLEDAPFSKKERLNYLELLEFRNTHLKD